jgi:hypothetical protein
MINESGRPLVLVLLEGGIVAKVYCSHRCEALARPIPPWTCRLPEGRRR